MFTTLVESRAKRQRSLSGTIASVALHTLAIGTAVTITMTTDGGATVPPPRERPLIYTTVHPRPVIEQPRQSSGAPAPTSPTMPTMPQRVIIAPTTISDHIPPIELSLSQSTTEDPVIGRGLPETGGFPAGGPGVRYVPGEVVNENVVERQPRLVGNPPIPRYPSALRESGIAGRVVMRFVIDTTGRAESDGVVVVETSHALFAEAVRSVLWQYRFSPGEVGGHRVRTLVQMPFAFTLR